MAKIAAIGAREQAVVDGEFVGEVASAASGADGIDVADDVGHGDVGLWRVFRRSDSRGHPGERGVVAVGGDFFRGKRGRWVSRDHR